MENHKDMANICGMMEALIKEISIMGFEMAKESGKMDKQTQILMKASL